jgi:hypothetical protein
MAGSGLAGPRSKRRPLFEAPDRVIKMKRAHEAGQTMSRIDGGIDPAYSIFPSDLSSHYMAFLFKRHKYDGHSKEKLNLVNTILLPISQNVVEQINVDYNTSALGAVRGEISDLIAEGSRESAGAAGGKFVKGAAAFLAGIFNTETYTGGNDILGAATLGLRTGNEYVAAGLNRFFGSAPNPHLTVLFQGVGLRTHNFTWKLSPANRDESVTLSRIINAFRGAALPARGAHNLTLDYPYEVDIFIGGSKVEHLYHFKRSVIRNFSVNYAPDGTPSFFRDGGAPTAVQLQLDLMETEIHTRGDYEPNVRFDNMGPNPDELKGEILGKIDKESALTDKEAGDATRAHNLRGFR